MAEMLERFPLFPLGMVLLPREVVPLHIFEERYKQMIGECLEEDTSFGIVWVSDEGVKDIGCTADITQLVEELDDGRMNILVEGDQPFRLVRRIDDMAYPAGDVQLIDEDEEGYDEDEEGGEAGPLAHARYSDLVEKVTESRPPDADVEELDAYGMAATLDFGLGAKQQLLELRSEEERLEHLTQVFEAAMKRLDYAEAAAVRARSNGKIRLEP
jgi:Lon protease-like protein